MASGGQRAKLSRPLDFMVVSDHSVAWDFSRNSLAVTWRCWRHPNGMMKSIPARERTPPSISLPALANRNCQPKRSHRPNHVLFSQEA
jgi:hypothetical protein